MNLVAGLIIFAVLGAWLSARYRAAGLALVFGVFAAVLFCTTPLGQGLPGLLAGLVQEVSSVGGQVADGGGAR